MENFVTEKYLKEQLDKQFDKQSDQFEKDMQYKITKIVRQAAQIQLEPVVKKGSEMATDLGEKASEMATDLGKKGSEMATDVINNVSRNFKKNYGIQGEEFNVYVRENLKVNGTGILFFTGLDPIIQNRLTSSNRPVLFDEIITANTHAGELRTLRPSDFVEGAKFGNYTNIAEDIITEMYGALLIEGLFVPSRYTQGFMDLQFKGKNVTTLPDGKSLPTPNEENGFDTVFLCIQPQRHLGWGTSKAYILSEKNEDKYLDYGKPKWGNFDVYYDKTNRQQQYIIMDGSMSGARLGGKKTRGKNKKNSRKRRSMRRR